MVSLSRTYAAEEPDPRWLRRSRSPTVSTDTWLARWRRKHHQRGLPRRHGRDYYWEYLITSFSSASRAHLTWLRDRIHGATGLSGNLTETTRTLRSTVERNPFFE